MSLVHGEDIGAEELESVVAGPGWDAGRFARLCNAIVWVQADKQRSHSLSLTERVLVADNGIDAMLEMDAQDEEPGGSRYFVNGLNIYQYKKRAGGGNRRTSIDEIRRKERSAVKQIFEKTHRRPDSYLLFVNLDLSHDDKLLIKQSILEGYDRELKVEIIGAAELAAALNNMPHLRSAFFAGSDFQTWNQALEAHLKQKVPHAALVGRDDELKRLKDLIDDPRVRVVVISGHSGVGKSRLLLEATRHRRLETVSAVDPQSLSVRQLCELESPGLQCIVLVEEPDPENLPRIEREVLARDGLKAIVTTLANPPKLPDDRVQSLKLEPLPDDAARKLLRAAGAQMDFSLESWVLAQAGGNPELLLGAVALGSALREQAQSLVLAMAEIFEERIRTEAGERGLTLIRLLSLLTYVGAKQPHQKELKLICDRLGGPEIDLNVALLGIDRLVAIGFLRIWGPYVEVIPPFLANHLAEEAIRGRLDAIVSLLAVLPLPAQSRFLARISRIGGEEANAFRQALFEITFRDLKSVLAAPELADLIVDAMPGKATDFIARQLEGLDTSSLRSFSTEERRTLRRIVERLWLRKSTCRQAMAILIRLALLESEEPPRRPDGYGFTNLLIESMLAMHPQVPLTCAEKFDVVQQLIRLDAEPELRFIGVKAIAAALEEQSVILRESMGPEPLDARPPQTYGDIASYHESLIRTLINLADDSDPRIAAKAREVLPRSLYLAFIQRAPEAAMDGYATAVARALRDPDSISLARLRDSLERALRALSEWRQKDGRKELEEWAAALDRLLNEIKASPVFGIRIRNLVGGWTYSEENENQFYALAEEALAHPDVLTPDLLNWLCSEKAERARHFFWALGRKDEKRAWLGKIREHLSKPCGPSAFEAYLGGLAENQSTDDLLDTLVEARDVEGRVVATASLYSRDIPRAVRRLCALFEKDRIDQNTLSNLVASPWLKQIDRAQFLKLIQLIAGANFELALGAVRVLDAAIFREDFFDAELIEFAWKCVRKARDLDLNDFYYCDHVAAKLAVHDPESGFSVFRFLLRRPSSDRSWNPVEPYSGQSQFWRVLNEINHERAILELLTAVAETESFGDERRPRTWRSSA